MVILKSSVKNYLNRKDAFPFFPVMKRCEVFQSEDPQEI